MNVALRFKRLFVCLDVMKKGFVKGCRPWVGIDGYHLKGSYREILLSIVTVDANKGIFSLALAIMEIGSKSRWKIFLYHLHALCTEPKCVTINTYNNE